MPSPDPSPLASPTDPWQMLPGESTRAFRAFVAYRDLGTSRTLRGACAALADGGVMVSRRYVGGLSSLHGWVERARAYDAAEASRVLAVRGDETLAGEVESYRRRTLAAARALADRADAMVAAVGARLGALRPEELRPSDLPRYLDTAVRVREAAASAEAQAIGLTELVRLLESPSTVTVEP